MSGSGRGTEAHKAVLVPAVDAVLPPLPESPALPPLALPLLPPVAEPPSPPVESTLPPLPPLPFGPPSPPLPLSVTVLEPPLPATALPPLPVVPPLPPYLASGCAVAGEKKLLKGNVYDAIAATASAITRICLCLLILSLIEFVLYVRRDVLV
jgi:hypothetical protein